MKLLSPSPLVPGKSVAFSGDDVLDHSAGRGQMRTNPGACVSDRHALAELLVQLQG